MEPRQYVVAVLRRWPWVVAAGLLGAAATGGLAVSSAPAFSSTAGVYVGVSHVAGAADLATGSLTRQELLPSVAALVRSGTVLAPVAATLGLPASADQLAGQVVVTTDEETSILQVTTSAASPAGAARLTAAVVDSTRTAAGDLFAGPDGTSVLELSTVAPPNTPRGPSAPDTRRDTVLGLLAGTGAATLLAGLAELARPSIASVAGLEAVAGVPLLGRVPGRSRRRGSPPERQQALERVGWSLAARLPTGASVGLVGTRPARVTRLVDELSAGGLRPFAVAGPAGAGTTGSGPDGLVVVLPDGRLPHAATRRLVEQTAAGGLPVLGVLLEGSTAPAGTRSRLRTLLAWRPAQLTALPSGTTHPPGVASRGATTGARTVAVAALVLVGQDQRLAAGTSVGLVVTLGLLPVWIGALPRFRGAVPLVGTLALAVLSGVLLSARSSADHTVDALVAVDTTGVVLTGLGTVGLVLWARTVLPWRTVALSFGVGMLATAVTHVPLSDNPYKFELALPLTIITLSLVGARRRPGWAVAALLAFAVLSIVNDGRSAMAFNVAAAGLVLWQLRSAGLTRRASRLATAGLLVVLGVSGYYAFTELLVSGALGAQVQARSTEQLAQSGSLLLGGRPEWSGTLALMRQDPLGFGVGVVPQPQDVQTVKQGFAHLRIPSADGYIEHYLLHGAFELHSIAADLWVGFGPVGLAAALLTAVLLVRGLAALVARRQAPALLCLLVLTSVWSLAFGPLQSDLAVVVLTLGLVLADRREPGPREDTAGDVVASSVTPSTEPPPGRSTVAAGAAGGRAAR